MAKPKDQATSTTPPWLNAGANPVQAPGPVATTPVADQSVSVVANPGADSTAPTPMPAPTAAPEPVAVVTPTPAPETALPAVVAAAAMVVGAPAPVIEVASELVDMVTVTVPRAFKLRIDNFRELEIKAGIQEMERAHAEHWYAKANKVQIYTGK